MSLMLSRGAKKGTPRVPLLKRLIWIYFLLLIFEGALRKWIVPQLSAPLLIVRDPVAFLIIWEAYRTNKWPREWSSLIGLMTFMILGLCAVQLIAGDSNLIIELFGLRSYLLPFPVAIIMGAYLDKEDLLKFGRCMLRLLLPLVCLEILQYISPPGSFWNRGAFEGGQQISYAGSHVRASGTFSFATGMSEYVVMSTVFVFYGMVNRRFAKRWLLFAASGALILAVPITGSRGMLVGMAGVLAFVIIAALFGISQFMSSVRIILALLIVSVLVAQLPIFSRSMTTFQERLRQGAGDSTDVASGTSRTFSDRLTRTFSEAIDGIVSAPHWYGSGLGLGSTVGAVLMGTYAFIGGEGIIGRTIFEFGPLVGSAFILFRCLLGIYIALCAFERMRDGHILAWLFVPMLFTDLVFGVLEQPTAQGFLVVVLGFCLAELKNEGDWIELGALKLHARSNDRIWRFQRDAGRPRRTS